MSSFYLERVGRSVRAVEYTALEACERCDRVSTPKRVHYRSELHRTLCMGCWNRERPLMLRRRRLAEIRKLVRRLEREAARAAANH